MDRSIEGRKVSRENTLWVVTELYYPELTSTGYYLTTIAESLAGDRKVKVLAGQPTYSARGHHAPKNELRNGVEIIRAWGTTLDKNVLPFRLLNMFTLAMSIFFKALFQFRLRDQVLVVTNPQSLPVTTALAALLRGANYSLLVHDSYPEILIAVGALKPDSFIVTTINYINRWVYKHAAGIIVMGRDMNDLFLQKTAGLDIPIVTIPNWAELDSVYPAEREKNKLLSDLGLSEKLVFMFAGNLGHPIDVKTLVEAAERLVDVPTIHFIFIGSGAKRKWLEDRVRLQGLSNVTILDERPRSEQQEFLSACDVGLVALIRGMKGAAMPSKTYNIMAAGKPILALAESGSEIARMIDEEDMGWSVTPGDPDALCTVVKYISEHREDLPERGKRARSAAMAKYSLQTALEAYRRALK
ncbi:glycosyltransferase family 4 protein [soil metagenome]